MINLNNINVFYGKSKVLYDISLSVKPGEVVALIGANGAGKTTTLKAISGLIKLNEGDITYKGSSINGISPDRIATQGIAHVPERGGIFANMTVAENLQIGAVANSSRNDANLQLKKVLELFPILKERGAMLGGLLSGGERQMLAIGRAMMGNPELYLLDEPTLGLSPIMVWKLADIITEISQQGGTILLVEQNARMALEISHRGYVLELGRIVQEGPSQELLKNETVKRSYLGS